jgi:prepilin-type N-terminal cleavage/methylation domain-containing protein/prepilin-type processing-associated H-X9-DG protein
MVCVKPLPILFANKQLYPVSPRFDEIKVNGNVSAGWFGSCSSRRSREAFTLIELLVCIAIIGLLAGLLLPALAQSKARAQTVTCISNNRQLSLAWMLYTGDFSDHLVYNLGGKSVSPASSDVAAPAGLPNWVDNVMDWSTSSDNTNTDFVSTSLLGPYASKSFPIFHCPADRALSAPQRQAGWTYRARSVSMNGMVGDPGALLDNGKNVNNPYYRQFLKESDIPKPADLFVFLDEHPDSINDGYFIEKPTLNDAGLIDTNNLAWTDLPGSYHNGGGSFTFADGHTEIHHWINAVTLCPPVPEGAPLPMSIAPAQAADFYWVLRRMSVFTGY